MVAPTVYGGNCSFHRSREVAQFTVGADSIIRPFVSVKLFDIGRTKALPYRVLW